MKRQRADAAMDVEGKQRGQRGCAPHLTNAMETRHHLGHGGCGSHPDWSRSPRFMMDRRERAARMRYDVPHAILAFPHIISLTICRNRWSHFQHASGIRSRENIDSAIIRINGEASLPLLIPPHLFQSSTGRLLFSRLIKTRHSRAFERSDSTLTICSELTRLHVEFSILVVSSNRSSFWK